MVPSAGIVIANSLINSALFILFTVSGKRWCIKFTISHTAFTVLEVEVSRVYARTRISQYRYLDLGNRPAVMGASI